MGEYLGFEAGYRAQALRDLRSRVTDQMAEEEVRGQKRVWQCLWAAARHSFLGPHLRVRFHPC